MSARTIVLFGSYDVELHPRVAVLRDGLAATENVTEINVPLGMSTTDKINAASSLAGTFRLLVAVGKSWVGLLRQRNGRPRQPDLVVVGYMGHFDVHLARLLWPRSTIAVDHLVGLADTSRERGVATGLKARVLDLIDRLAVRQANIVIVDTDEQLERLPQWAHAKSVVIPVGATEEWSQQPPVAPAPPMRVCFVGIYTSLHGAPVIGEAISLLADDDRIQFTMIGSGQERERTESAASANPNVTWIDWVDSRDLPGVVASHHVSLGIFGTTPKALSVTPTKAYQGLAAGTIVVTSDTAPQRRALGDDAVFVPPGDAHSLAAALRELADVLCSETTDRNAASDPSARRRFSPPAVVQALLARLDESRQ